MENQCNSQDISNMQSGQNSNMQGGQNQGVCPCCGYCPMCKRQNAQPYYPSYPWYTQPYVGDPVYPYPYYPTCGVGTVTYGTTMSGN